ncbi:BT_3987 domain-containing protein [Sediminitomix flava]|uniref:Uncharacterized protein DUF1735 n=1 Tax=Sediminitomix flava TaxID=379075 RepID=A0A315YZK1_SEDFL|nr:DUF1735 domain-containing protein [Sediminitomix flava]PWJ35015.1 uncharacterized protein DUF1735 [Sediminitomix flava]
MKKILSIITLGLALSACYPGNQENEFPDFDQQNVYFPIQSPVRTLILGEDYYDNSLDQEYRFNVGVAIGGLRENTKDWTADFQVENSLVDNLIFAEPEDDASDYTMFEALPASYYELGVTDQVTIPAGSFVGLIPVQLTDAFFEDPKAVEGRYVLPLKLTGTSADSVLSGLPASGVENPDLRLDSDWTVSPKNYTLFAVKYINELHGEYLRRGKTVVTDEATGNEIRTDVYRADYVVEDALVSASTSGRRTIVLNSMGKYVDATHQLAVEFPSSDAEGQMSLSLSSVEGSTPVEAVGTANVWVNDGDQWGGTPDNPTKRDVIYLNYTFMDNDGYINEVFDTLVYRNNGIDYEEFTISLMEE